MSVRKTVDNGSDAVRRTGPVLGSRMNILLIGSGGREHALAWKMAQSPHCDRLFIAPGNGGTGALTEHVALDVADHGAVVAFCRGKQVRLVVIGPEAPLVDGLADTLCAQSIPVFGPSAAAAQLEGSKAFTKALCDRMDIPTAAYAAFDTLEPALDYLKTRDVPIVIKADGLAAGKGVTVAQTQEEAQYALHAIFSDGAGSVVIEECLTGEEASLFFLCDGTTALPFSTAQDHKRVGDGDVGPNTGGMGAYSPADVIDAALETQILGQMIEPTLRGMAEAGTPFSGVLYAGVMLTTEGPKLIEYNVRFGDPECQVLMARLESDLVLLLLASANGDLDGHSAQWSNDVALTVVMAAKGYPGAYGKGSRIDLPEDGLIFHAGTALEHGTLVATGGRVLAVTALGDTVRAAQERAYAQVDRVDWPEGFCRRDIGWRAVARDRD